MFRKLDPARAQGPKSTFAPGPAPILDWISTESLWSTMPIKEVSDAED